MMTLEKLREQPMGEKYATLSPSSCSPSLLLAHTVPSFISFDGMTVIEDFVLFTTMPSVSFVYLSKNQLSTSGTMEV